MRKFILSCLFWGVFFEVLGFEDPDFKNTCPECRPLVEVLYQEVMQAITTFNTLSGVVENQVFAPGKTGIEHANGGLHVAQQTLATHNLASPGLEGYIDSAAQNYGQMLSGFSTYSDQRYNLNNTLQSMRVRLVNFECHCSSNCACIPLLTSISNFVDGISYTLDDQYTLLSNRLTKIDDFMYDDLSKLVDDYQVTWSSSFTNKVLSWGLLSKWLFRDDDADSAWRQFQQQFDESLANHPETGLSNEGFIGLRQLDTLQKMMYINASIAEMFANYKNNSTTNETDLSAITNYLYNIQLPFYSSFNNMFKNGTIPSPFIPVRYTYVTNFFQNPSARNFSFLLNNPQSGYTNFFSRVELYLMALNGFFSDNEIVPDDQWESIYGESQIDYSLDNATNNLAGFETDSASLTNYINTSWIEGITAIFDKMNDTTVFEGDTGDGRYITFIPSFTLGGIQIEHLDFDIETIRPVIDFSNAAFRCIWAAIYLVVFFVFVWFVGARVFRVMLWLVQFISGSLGN